MLENMHPAYRAAFGAEAERLQREYRAPLHISVGNADAREPRTGEAFAWTDGGTRGFPITVNARFFGPYGDVTEARKRMADMMQGTRAVERKPADIVTHEYGHVLVDHLHIWTQNQFGHELKNYLRPYADTERRLFSALSQYGVSDPWEAMAEAFVLMDRGADHPAAYIAEKFLGKFRR